MTDETELDDSSERPADDTPNAADPVALKVSARQRKQRAAEEAEALKGLLSTEAGRRLYAKWLYEWCGVFNPTANAAFDANGLHFKEGARGVGLLLHNEALQKARALYMVLISETLPHR